MSLYYTLYPIYIKTGQELISQLLTIKKWNSRKTEKLHLWNDVTNYLEYKLRFLHVLYDISRTVSFFSDTYCK